MSNDCMSRFLGLSAEELSSGAARETSSELDLPTLDERVRLYSRAIRKEHDRADEAYSLVRDRILDAMAADIAAKSEIHFAQEPNVPEFFQGTNPNEAAVLSDLLEVPHRYAFSQVHPSALSSELAEHAPDLLVDLPMMSAAKTAAMSEDLTEQKIATRLRPAPRLAMLTISIFAVAVTGGLATVSLMRKYDARIESSAAIPKSGKVDVAGQSSQSPLTDLPQIVARNEPMTPQTTLSANAPAMESQSGPSSQRAIVGPSPLSSTASPGQLTAEQIGELIKRGRELIAVGKILNAREVLRLAAEAGDATAALALATTYDPIELKKLKVSDAEPDVAMARTWYQKAKDLELSPVKSIPQDSNR
ncbi:MAG: hypothetical protein C5B47_03995 [Verrucomicrobia bacterium]|nr:MAG: hypothetical protein C5B47_03995 [Verrucomicrobiota bacterium]